MTTPSASHALSPASSLFTPVRLGTLLLRNRLAVAPMTRTSASVDGRPTEAMERYYATFARGGFSLVITEGTYVDEAYSQCYDCQPGLVTEAQVAAWQRVVIAVHRAGGRLIVQLMHGGALVQGNGYRERTIAPSALQPRGEKSPSYGGSGPFALPLEASESDLQAVIAAFAATAARACLAGFDGVELHGGTGYLFDQFLTIYTNRRRDRFGGVLENRLRLLHDAVVAVRAAVGRFYTVGVRLSQTKLNDRAYRWDGITEAATIFGTLAAAGASYLHVTERDALAPAFARGPSLAALARRYGDLPVIANGRLDDPARAAHLLHRGDADMVSLGRGALANADWPRRVAGGRPLAPLTEAAFRRPS